VHAVIAELASTSDVDGEATDNHWAWQQANTVP
jgi:hypothetical protein